MGHRASRRRTVRSLVVWMGWLAAVASPGVAQEQSGAAGRYDFESRSLEGDPFSGTILVHGSPDDGYDGVLISTIRAPGRLVSAERRDDRVRLSFDLGGPQPVFELQLDDGRLAGRWLLAGREGPVSGSYATGPYVDVEPRACVLAGVEGSAECGVLHVPEDRDDPDGRRIPLRVAILPAHTPEPRGALFHFAGGPGQAATQQAGGNAARFQRIRASRDIVMIDQRGTGGSNPLTCDWGSDAATVRAILAWELPPDRVEACRERLRERADLRLYTTRHAAHDVELVRRWLGYGPVDLYGGSYGTRAALEYARRYPASIRTVTLRGVMPPGGSMAVTNAVHLDAELHRVLSQCDEDEACASAYPTLQTRYEDLRRELAARPRTLEVTHPRSGDTVRVLMDEAALAGSLRRLLMSEQGRQLVPRAIASTVAGVWDDLAAGVVATLSVVQSLYFGMSLSVACAEEVPFTQARDWEGETSGTLMGPRAAVALRDACAMWDHLPADPTASAPVRLEAPALFLAGEHDPATPLRWAEEAAASAPNGRVVVFRGGSHASFPECALDLMASMVESGTTNGLEAACESPAPAMAFALP